MTHFEREGIKQQLKDWAQNCIARDTYPQILITMRSPDELLIHKISAFDNKETLIRYLKIVVEQLEKSIIKEN